MSISDNYAPDKSLGNGVTDTFTGTWKVLNEDYFRCALEDVATGVQTLLTQGSDYTLTFDDTGYSAKLSTPPSSAYYVIRYRAIEVDQTNPYKTSKGFQGQVIEDSLDKLTGIAQDMTDAIRRSPKFRVGSTLDDVAMDDPEDGKCMKWDATNERYVNSDNDPDEMVSDAEAARDAAVVAQGLAEDAEDAAVAAQGIAESARDDAVTANDLAEDWATKLSATVDGSENSAKAYAQENLGVSGRDEGGSAKDWAQTAEDQEVSGGEFSAKHYAAKAAGFVSGGLVKISANDTTAGYVNGKLVAGNGIALTETNDGGNETLVASVTAANAGIDVSASGIKSAMWGAMIRKSSAQSIPTGASTAITFDTEVYDTAGAFDAGTPNVFTVPAGVSYAKLSVGVAMGTNTTGYYSVSFTKNTSAAFYGNANDAVPANIGAYCSDSTPWFPVAEGDVLGANVLQTSGNALNVVVDGFTYFAVEFI